MGTVKVKPFFINSNICLKEDDISSYKKFMNSVAGNTGNSYITYALIKELFGGLVDIKHIQNIYEYNFDNSPEVVDYINNEATHVFLILQDQIRIAESYGLKLPYQKIKEFIAKLNKPVIIAGLGANSFEGFDNDFHKKLGSDLTDFLKFLSDHCPEIGIRGYFTQEVLHKIGIDNTRVIGCPSFYENGRNRIIEKREINDLKSVVLTSRLPLYMPEIHKIAQDYLEEDIIKPIAFNLIEDNLSQQHIESFYNQTYHIFSNIEEWKNYIKNFKFALGYRLHGSVLAINAGVPALCMNGDSRAAEMCSFLKIPHNPNLNIQDEKEILKIYEGLDFTELNKNYPALYDNFVDFLHKNNLLHHEENSEFSDKQQYIKQPSLKLYGDKFYPNLDNRIFISNKINDLITQIEKRNEELNNNKKILKEYGEEIKSLKMKMDYLTEKSEKPTSFEQIFSVKNKENHKVVRILGIKFKFRRYKCA